MPPKKRTRVEAVPHASKEDIAAWVRNNDPLLGTTSVTIAELFDTTTIKKFDKQTFCTDKRQTISTGESFSADWSALKAELEGRSADSPQWFIQLRKEDLTLEPDGCIGQRVESFVIVESSSPTLCPAYYVVATPLPYSDAEDHVPESFHHLADQGVKWFPIVKANGDSINAFFMKRDTPKINFGGPVATSTAPATAPASGGFGAGFGSNAAPTTTIPTGFSFGAAPAASTPSVPASFTFGAAPAPAAVPATFSFGSAAPASSSTTTPTVGFGFSTNAAPKEPPMKRIPVEDILFCVWSTSRIKSLQKEIKEGSRIVIENAKLPGISKPFKVQMQDDMKEKPDRAAREFVLNKVFAKQSSRIKDFDDWMGNVPEFNPTLIAYLQNTREKILKSEAKESSEFATLEKDVVPAVEALLRNAIADREPHRRKQKEILEGASKLMKEGKLVAKEHCNIIKFYPSNKDIPFRPYGRVSGISEEGDVIRCVPEAWRNKNPFLTK